MDKWKLAGILFCLCGLGPLCAQQTPVYRTVFSAALERHLAQYPQVYATPGVGRFEWMKSYAPSNTVRRSPRVREQLFGKKKRIQEQVEAVSVFLFNMYISTAAYREDMPAQLTLDYVGALDGFFKCEEMIPLDKVQDFYTSHREEIQTRLAELFAQKGIAEYKVSPLMNEMRERRFLQVLASAPTHEKWPGYVWTGTTRLTAFAYREDTRQLRSLVRRSLAESSRKVIVFEVSHMEFEDLDNPLALPRNKAEHLYRCVNDECAYCSYWLGKRVCEQVASSADLGDEVRLYKIAAWPVGGGFLKPATSDKFTLADGEQAPSWFYHAATLVVIKKEGRYMPLVVDKFLVGEEPILLEEWVRRFRPGKTYFMVEVFERSQQVESVIAEPSSRLENDVVVGGAVYHPYPVLSN